MEVPAPATLIAQIGTLPAAGPLLARLPEDERGGVYLVGGSVRDLLRGGRPLDLDLVVEGDAGSLVARLGPGVDVRAVHDRFGTSTLTLDGFTYDIARARRETYAHPGALPYVEPASLYEDLRRRDFTVNAIAVALGGPLAGALTAVPSALQDLAAGTLRVLHERSFIDDPTRLLRLVRYRTRLSFAVEPLTLELARAAVANGALATVSGARIGAELRLLAREPDPLAALGALAELGLDAAIEPRFGIDDPALGRRAFALLPEDGRRDRLALALASRRLESEELARLLDSLSFDASDRDAIVAAATGSSVLARELVPARRASEIARAVGRGGPELVALAGALGPERAARDWLTRLRHVTLEIDGGDLLAAGIPQGPAIGRGLEAALADKLDGLVDGRAAELARALEAARASG